MGMSESRSFLERRLKLMLQKPVKRKLLVAVLFGSMSITLVTLAAQVSPPIMSDTSKEHTPWVRIPCKSTYSMPNVRRTHLSAFGIDVAVPAAQLSFP